MADEPVLRQKRIEKQTKAKRRLVYASDGKLMEQPQQPVPMLPDLYPK